jgi:hypothetical protein
MSTLDEPDHAIIPRPAKIDVPEDVTEAIRVLIRWAGDDPEREGLSIRPSASRARGRNIARVIGGSGAIICRAPSKKSAAMTRSCC